MAYETVSLSAHAARRTLDRSIPEIGHLLLREFGTRRPAGGGTERIDWDKQSWKEVERVCGVWPLKKMDQLRRLYMIVGANGVAVTVAYRD